MIMEFSYKAYVQASKQDVWRLYADVRSWYVWEGDLENITLEGAFETGSTGSMKLAGMPPLDYTLTNVVEHEAFCDATPTPLGVVHFDHHIEEAPGGVCVEHRVRLEAPEANEEALAFLKQVFSDVPDSVMALKAAAER